MIHRTLNDLGGEIGSTWVGGEVGMKREEREDEFNVCKLSANRGWSAVHI